jgi:hypothetical protein
MHPPRLLLLPLLVVPLALAALPAPRATAQRPGPKRFTDVSAASGLVVAKGCLPHAVAVADLDGDGLSDVIIGTFEPPHVYLFKNLGGLRFKDVTKGSGLEAFKGTCSGVAVGDFDNDGKLDVYLTSVRGAECRLFRGKGDLTFEDVSKKSGTLLPAPARSCAWSDVDGDGRIDLFVTSPKGLNRLFRNKGDGTFEDISVRAGIQLPGRHNLGCAFGDVDGDGLDDLFVTSYQSGVSALFKNLGGGKFRDVTPSSGLGRRASTVGCVLADVFNSGRLDLFVTTDSWLSGANYTEKQLLGMKHTVEPNALYRNEGGGRFRQVDAAELAHKSLGHDAVVEDLDHAGRPEIYVAVDAESANKWATSKGGNPLWTRPDGKGWREVSKAWGVAHEANCVCVAAADFDGDGDLDLLLVNFYSAPVLYRNNTDDNNWLRVRPVGKRSNRAGIGAQVRVFDTRGGKKELVDLRHVQSGSGYCRSGPLEAHFGLGKSPAPHYRVEVFFPATKARVVLEKAAPGRAHVVQEPGR